MSAARCFKLALLLTLIPLALRATTLFLGGHGEPVTTASSRHAWSWTARHGTTATIVVSAGGPARGRDWPYRPHAHATHRRRAASASDGGGTRRLRQDAGAAGDWFEDDKRLAPTGSNPLHNLR